MILKSTTEPAIETYLPLSVSLREQHPALHICPPTLPSLLEPSQGIKTHVWLSTAYTIKAFKWLTPAFKIWHTVAQVGPSSILFLTTFWLPIFSKSIFFLPLLHLISITSRFFLTSSRSLPQPFCTSWILLSHPTSEQLCVVGQLGARVQAIRSQGQYLFFFL